ncbi:hypothetical protein IMCC21224_13264 [Puniceibacterium sp. IMCC21224]|nr:hypothetical protein IMCC21224_13264 [Puniceibacterium sp. IMCC21224]
MLQRYKNVANLLVHRRQAEGGMHDAVGMMHSPLRILRRAESKSHGTDDAIQVARCCCQKTCCIRHPPKHVKRATRCGVHATPCMIREARCRLQSTRPTRPKTRCRAQKTPCIGRDARCRERGTRCIERGARCIRQWTSNRPRGPIFYIEYKPLMPSPLVLGEGGLVRRWQEIGTLTSKCHAAAD